VKSFVRADVTANGRFFALLAPKGGKVVTLHAVQSATRTQGTARRVSRVIATHTDGVIAKSTYNKLRAGCRARILSK